MKQELEEGQIVLCTVTKIGGTIVFVKIEDYDIEGTIVFSEISPGRIRNIRDYAFPGKRIICKILKIDSGGTKLSLRRVKQKEKNEFNETYKKEKSFVALLKSIIKNKEDVESIIIKIKDNEESLENFLETAKENPKLFERYIKKEDAEKIEKILQEKKVREIILKRRFSLFCRDSSGIIKIKSIIKQSIEECTYGENKNCDVSYIGAGKYLIKIKSKKLKQADQQIEKIMENIEKLAKQHDCYFLEEK